MPGNNVPACSRDFLAHYSFDFAQQVHYPSDPLQPGPVYFKTPRKCGIFGVMTEALPHMILFLLDEAVETGKGANTVISMLDFFFEAYGMRERRCHLHADNCCGQNKNNAMLHYLMWRVMTGRHEAITLSFLLAGHTKFGPDACFGLFKRKFRKTRVDCLDDISQVAASASASGILTPQLCGDQEGNTIVHTRDWTAFLGQWFRKLVGLKRYHHFEFKLSNGKPEVHCREYVDSGVEVYSLLREPTTLPDELPPTIRPNGLSSQRQEYLYQEIREFVDFDKQDLVCPKPPQSSSKQTSSKAVPSPRSPQPSTSGVTPAPSRTPGRPKKKKRGLGAKTGPN